MLLATSVLSAVAMAALIGQCRKWASSISIPQLPAPCATGEPFWKHGLVQPQQMEVRLQDLPTCEKGGAARASGVLKASIHRHLPPPCAGQLRCPVRSGPTGFRPRGLQSERWAHRGRRQCGGTGPSKTLQPSQCSARCNDHCHCHCHCHCLRCLALVSFGMSWALDMVETRRIELPTFALRTRRSPS